MNTHHRHRAARHVPAPEVRSARRLEDLWDRHGGSVYSLACTLLGDATAAATVVRLAMTDLAEADSASVEDDHRSWSGYVYRRSQELGHATSGTTDPSVITTSLSRLAQPQRTCLALCLFGGHTSQEVGSLLGVPAATVADLLTSGLRELQRLGADDTAAVA